MLVMKNKSDNMLLEKATAPAQAGWTAPIAFVPTKHEPLIFCVDHRELHAATKRGVYPKPFIDECIAFLGEDAVFSTIDANNGYWQANIENGDQEKKLRTSHHGLYRNMLMPFV